MYLSEIKFVDLKRSKWDKQKSKPKKGEYVFTEKRYVNDERDEGYPELLFRWNRNDPKDIADWTYKWKFSLVHQNENLVWPEGLVPDAEGHFVYGDCILMKIRTEDYIAKRKPEIERSEYAAKRYQEKVKAMMVQDARRAGLENPERIPEDFIIEEIKTGPRRALVTPKRLYPDTK